VGVVEDFLTHYNARDWERLADCFSVDDFERIGPFVDVISDSAEYVAFLRRVVPTLGDDYHLGTERVVYVPGEQTAFAQLIEHYAVDGNVRDTPEVIIFGLDGRDRIRRMRLYVQRPGAEAPAGGKDAMGTQS